MSTNVDQIIRKLEPTQRKKVETRASQLIAEETELQFNGSFIPEALCRRRDISASAKLIYGLLVRYAGADGWCIPAVPTLAAEVGLKTRRAQECLAELESAGLLLREARPGTSNRYRFIGEN